ncbi:LapA family protein [Anoxynatronum sibiricum]|uniref:Lipopolysaccharide assembly protein LapA domain-containing protein n=1 Tax=Anoxynatronum sibiricum TaxID=210623 RepID=A0ABU9VNY9_9CLOT
MRKMFLFLALLIGILIAVIAIINQEVVTVNYLLGTVSLTLFMLILVSAAAGAVLMGFLGIFRSIHNYVNSQGDRGYKKELERRIKLLESEKEKLEAELNKQQKEREHAAAKAYGDLENEKKKLEDELANNRNKV